MKFRKKPVVIEARQWDGSRESAIRLAVWSGCAIAGDHGGDGGKLVIDTLEGDISASPGDWIIRGVRGEFYPCKPDIFAATYEPADAPAPDPESRLRAFAERCHYCEIEYEQGVPWRIWWVMAESLPSEWHQLSAPTLSDLLTAAERVESEGGGKDGE